MPYGKRRYSAKRRSSSGRNLRRIKHRRPSARNQRRQILANQRQLVSLKRHVELDKERLRWRSGFIEQQMTTFPYIIPLTSGPSPTNPAICSDGNAVPWTVTMTAAPQNINTLRSKVVINNQWLDLTINGGNEPSPLYVTAFVVQLQEDVAEQVYSETTQMSVLNKDSDYCNPDSIVPGVSSGYGAYLNSARFKIIERLEMCTIGPTIGWPGGPPGGNVGAGLGAALHRKQFKLNYGNTVLKSSGSGATSNTLEYSKIPAKHKRFVVIFTDNSTLDGQYPNVALSCLTTGYAAE